MPKTHAGNSKDTETLSSICKRNNWDERKARHHLRATSERKEGRWQWAKNDVPAIEKDLRAYFGKTT